MKKLVNLFLLFALVMGLAVLSFAQEIEAVSRITEVTVYPGNAMITRASMLKMNFSGRQEIIFSNIIPEVDEDSLRVSASGQAEVKILGAKFKKEFLEDVPAEKIKQLKEEIESLNDEKKKVQDIKQILLLDKQFLDSIRLFSQGQIPKDLVTRMPPAKELEDTYKFLDTKLRDNYLQQEEADLKIRALQKKIDALNKQLAQIQGPARKLKRSITVEIEVLKPGSLNLSLSYLVRGANWQPIYDARADFEKREVELVSYGIIKQATGEDWQDVEIALSTAKPSIGGRMPYVQPWFLRPYLPVAPEQKVMKRSAALLKQFEAFDKNLSVEAGLLEEKEQGYAEVEEKGIAVLYKIPQKSTIKSDGTEHKIAVSSQTLKADFEYSTYPRSVLNAYLGSRVTNAPNLQLLSGRVNIFLDGDFVGESSIDNIGPAEEFDLYLGVDGNVKVKREQIEKKVDETLIAGIPSPKKVTTYTYKITLENYKSKNIKVKIFESMPVSQDDRIKVRVDKVSLEPKAKDWKDRKGVWLWELQLEPKGKQEITYTYIIEQPREMIVEGLY